MKKKKDFGTLVCALLLVGCTSDDPIAVPSSDRQPVVFTATGIATRATRATVDGNWEGTSGNSVAVQIGSGATTKFTITTSEEDNTTATLTPVEELYWDSIDDLTVKAWYPYSESFPEEWKVKSDQTIDNNYINSDFIVAKEQTVTYANPTLSFEHQTAKIVVSIANSTSSIDQIYLQGVGGVERGTNIYMHESKSESNTYEAIVTPQSTAAVQLNIRIDGTNYQFFFDGTAKWDASNSYVYSLTIE